MRGLLLGGLFLSLLLVLGRVSASEKAPASPEILASAILSVCLDGVPRHKIEPFPRHPIVKNMDARLRLARAISSAVELYPRIDPFLLVAISYREGSFGLKTDGKLGEESTFQMMPRTARIISKHDPECSLEDVEGSAICAAAFLDLWSRPSRCGSIEGAISKYASGKGCRPPSLRVKWIIWDRLGIARHLKTKTDSRLVAFMK